VIEVDVSQVDLVAQPELYQELLLALARPRGYTRLRQAELL